MLGPTSIRRPPGVLVLAVNVLVEAHDHPAGDGHEDRARCGRSQIDLVGVAPWLNVQARIALARDALIRGDRVGAANLLGETRRSSPARRKRAGCCGNWRRSAASSTER